MRWCHATCRPIRQLVPLAQAEQLSGKRTNPDPIGLCVEAKGVQAFLAQGKAVWVAWCQLAPTRLGHLVHDDGSQGVRERAEEVDRQPP